MENVVPLSLWKVVCRRMFPFFGESTGVFHGAATAFQQGESGLSESFPTFFHRGWKTQIFFVIQGILFLHPIYDPNFPHSFPQTVENFRPQSVGNVAPRHVSEARYDISATESATFSEFPFVIPTNGRYFSHILVCFFVVLVKKSMDPRWIPFFHTTFPQDVGNLCGKVREKTSKCI